MRNSRILPTVVVVLVLLASLISQGVAAEAPDGAPDGRVHFYYFQDPGCESCHNVFVDTIQPLIQKYGDQLAMELLGIDDNANFDLMLDLELAIGGAAGGVPEVIIGDHVLAGVLSIQTELEGYIIEYLAQGGVALPTLGTPEAPTPQATANTTAGSEATKCVECEAVHAANRTAVVASQATQTAVAAEQVSAPIIHMAYFYQDGCDVCERSEHDLAYIEEEYPQVEITRHSIADETELNQYLCQKFGVPEEKHLTAPAFFLGDAYLLGEEIRARTIESLLTPYLSTGAPSPYEGWEQGAAQAQQTIVERFRSFGLLTVVGAGLIDGVNPCAFATMIFLISYLSVRKRQGRELLLTGLAFALGVFLTYLGVGFGFLKFLAALPFINTLGRWIYAATALLCLVLAVGSIMDYVKARQGRLHDMSFRLPDRLQRYSKKLIREGTSSRRFVLSAFLLGMGVSVVELACTGQVYLPTIVYVLGVPALQAQATLALVLYNLMFILPLVVIFVLVYFGTTSQQLVTWLNRHAATVKLAMAALFLVLAAWLIYSVVAL